MIRAGLLKIGIGLAIFGLLFSSLPVNVFALDESITDENIAVEAEPESELKPESEPTPEVANISPTSGSAVLSAESETPPEPTASPTIKISKIQIGDNENTAHEFVEIYNSGATAANLKGWQLQFLTAEHSGDAKPTRVLANFSEDLIIESHGFYSVAYGDYLVGEADAAFVDNYKNGSLATNGSVRLVDASGNTSDLVGWGSAAQRETKAVKIVTNIFGRCMMSDFTIADTDNNYEDFYEYENALIGQDYYPCSEQEPDAINQCVGLKLSEIGANLDDQFIEVHNITSETLDISGCGLKTNRSSAVFVFDNLELAADDYLAIAIRDTKLTLTKTTTGTVYLLDSAGNTIDSRYYENLKADTSWALIGNDWLQTYTPTPNDPNVYAQYVPCPVGQERNLDTGRCRKIVVDEPPLDCGPGKFRNPETNRCKSYNALTTTLAPCKEGQYRNPETNRCKSLTATTGPTPCKDGYERNPATNRCRKIRVNNGADYGLQANEEQQQSAFIAWIAVGAIVLGGLGYVGFEFRHEIGKFIKKLRH